MNKTITFTDKSGKTRKGTMVICPTCGTEFPSRLDQPQKYCSRPCAQKGLRRRITLVCDWCGTIFERTPAHAAVPKHGYHFCGRKCKDAAQRLDGITAIHPPHFGTKKPRFIYRTMFTEKEFVCARCGYSEFKPCVQIHHIDKDNKNNQKDNLIPLCANCHRALHFNLWSLSDLGL